MKKIEGCPVYANAPNRYVIDNEKAGTTETISIKDAIKLLIDGKPSKDYEISNITFNSQKSEICIYLQKYGHGYTTEYVKDDFLKDAKEIKQEIKPISEIPIKIYVLVNGTEAKDVVVTSFHFSPLGLDKSFVELKTI